jgi:hypothetical protein
MVSQPWNAEINSRISQVYRQIAVENQITAWQNNSLATCAMGAIKNYSILGSPVSEHLPLPGEPANISKSEAIARCRV